MKEKSVRRQGELPVKERHKPTVFFESAKEKWLEKVRQIAKDLFVPGDDEDDE